MLKLIGKKGCKACEELDEELTREGVEFEVVMLDDMDKDEKRKLIGIARESGHAYLPMLFDGERLIR